MTGVAADGVTQTVVKVAATAAGEVIKLTLTGDTSPGNLGSLRPLNSSSTNSSVEVIAIDTPLGPMAFAIYVAPKDFVRTGNTADKQSALRLVSLSAQNLTTGVVFPLVITIVRPLVILVHGLWSSSDTWNNFGVTTNNQRTLLIDDTRFNVSRANYQETNGDGLALNASVLKSQIDLYLYWFKSGLNRQRIKVAAVQSDFVTHSMGGILARTLATRPSYLATTNYQQGLIHKLITIDTPHLGSQFANRLYNSNDTCKAVFR